MRFVGVSMMAMVVLLSVSSAGAHDQQAIVEGKRVQPTPRMIEEHKKEHAQEKQAGRPAREFADDGERQPNSSAARRDREKKPELGKDEGITLKGK